MALSIEHETLPAAIDGVSPVRFAMGALDRGWVPDAAIRWGIRHMLRGRLREEKARQLDGRARAFADSLPTAPHAIHTDAANAQHYEVPAAFYGLALGPRRKYSCCLYDTPATSLAGAEGAMLQLTAERAEIANGQHILDLGCGWGALSLYLAERYPNARITGVSNSRSQRQFIDEAAKARGLQNLRIITADINTFVAPAFYDRVISVEMFEHLRNHTRMLQRIADWLRPGGKLFVHHFCHREYTYPYEASGPSDWMARHFFTGGMMPSYRLLAGFDRDLKVEEQWAVNGTHYQRTCMDWLNNLDANLPAAQQVLAGQHGADAAIWVRRWRVFFLACAELFGYNGGEEWFVAHCRLTRA